MCGRRLCAIPFPQTGSLRVEAAAYNGVDSRVVRTKRNEEVMKKRVCKRLSKVEDEIVCDDPSSCVLDDHLEEESSGRSGGCP